MFAGQHEGRQFLCDIAQEILRYLYCTLFDFADAEENYRRMRHSKRFNIKVEMRSGVSQKS